MKMTSYPLLPHCSPVSGGCYERQMYTTGSMLGENHGYTGGLAGADFVMSPKKMIKKTGTER